MSNGTLRLEWDYHLRDIYQFGDNNLPAGLVVDKEMAQLNRWGLAREFEVVGTHSIEVAWTEGQRIGQGLKLNFAVPPKPQAGGR